ncbi:helix-turn-helix domain-containing protein [Streptomyces sp. AV19]|uniref:helix-turn-helix domain-containing protein n=1 Tax=Streptomyces sp. AV19 TaxID=2793068 RepID=UPI0018FE114D|nr:helix-turn-helix transcriptional regulator [Streptomyces sp. AV19]MBH1936192.1 helix-turn-helix domain-containing protein [Streptomyces sp. AV19]MDG4534620.1 helix-turn-helix domain-containing protein [Streptomyces sp. AV19]
MGLRPNPTYRQRRLGSELRRMRNACSLSASSGGAIVDISSAHMSHIETGRTAIPEVKLRTLASAYGCNNEALVNSLVTMGRTTGRGWWSKYKHNHPASTLDLAELEASALACQSFQWLYIPGLLQLPEYTRALITNAEPEADKALLDACVEFRMRRQQVLAEGSALEFHAVIHETALHTQFVPMGVMRRQIEHLVEMSHLSHVHIQVLPLRANVFPVRFSTPFVLFEASVPELNTVYIEHPVSSPFISDQDQLVQFAATFEGLRTVALPAIDVPVEPKFHTELSSLGLIQNLLYSM